jgi:hypothetical protein
LQRYEEDPSLRDSNVIGNDMWVHHLMLKARDQTGDGNILVPHEKRSSEAYLYQKILLTFHWDKKRPILELYQEKDQTVSNATCSAMLKDKLKPAIRHKGKELLSKTVLLHHDNTQPHVMVATIETI